MCPKKRDENICCLTCENLLPIGEGDHLCDAADAPTLVLADYEPTEDFFWCGSSEYEGGDED